MNWSCYWTQGGGQHEGRILAGYYGFNTNISFLRVKQSRVSAHLTYLCFGLFCKSFGDIWAYLEINSFFSKDK